MNHKDKLYLIEGWKERLRTLSPEQLKRTIRKIENVRDNTKPPTTREERVILRAKAAGVGK